MIYFDIGANEGIWCLEIAKNNPDIFVYAFEPIPHLAERLIEKSKHLKNIQIVNAAIDLENGFKPFHISAPSIYGNHGCSSFLKFSDKSKTEWWGRSDFEVIETINVKTIRLEDFINNNNITQIDYIKIDTQGWDIKVLESLGDKINIVKSGELEAGRKDDILYTGQNTEMESVAFLRCNDFDIKDIELNDPFENEVNIKFIRNEKN